MTINTRDDSLDIIKGFCCLLMVIAHQPYFPKNPDVALGLIQHIANFIPPVLFFSISGVTASFQSTKYSLPSLSLYFLAMLLIGITWNIVLHGDVTSFYWPEIFQLIALGSLCVCVIERNGPAPQATLFLIGLAITLAKPVADRFWPDFDGWNFLFCDKDYVPQSNLQSQNSEIFPGFPFFPWIGYFIFGVGCYRMTKPIKLVLSIGSLCLVFISTTLGSSPIEKWDTSLAYIFTNFTVMFSFFWLFDGYSHAASALTEQLRKIGGNAFLFFFSHPFGIVAGVVFYAHFASAYIAWGIAIIVSVLAYNLFSRLKPWQLFESGYTWVLVIVAIILIPFLPQLIKQDSTLLITRLLAIAIGLITAINFSALAKLTKVKKSVTR